MSHFPEIKNINDVLPLIEGRPEFVVSKKDYEVTIINYVYRDQNTFTGEFKNFLEELRGITFCSNTGKLLSRKFHKFYNIGETEETSLENVISLIQNNKHQVFEKLDGSMITPLLVDGVVRWATKMGITEVSMQTETWLVNYPEYSRFAKEWIEAGYTPIFEWCSPQNQIVIKYEESKLVLLAMRHNSSGTYFNHNILKMACDMNNIPVVKNFDYDDVYSFQQFIEYTKTQENQEGYVIRFDDGRMVKIKSDWYVQLHKVKSVFSQENNVLKLVLNDALDDLFPLLNNEEKEKLNEYQGAVYEGISTYVNQIYKFVNAYGDLSRKEYAEKVLAQNKILHSLLFSALTNKDDRITMIKDFILKNITRNSGVEKIRSLIGNAKWI